jgi:transporter family-2 protein
LFELLQVLGLELLATGARASVVLRQPLNADLRASTGSTAWAAFISYLGGALAMVAVLSKMREPSPSSATVAQSSAAFGTIYIVVSILLLPRLGARAPEIQQALARRRVVERLRTDASSACRWRILAA